MAETTTNSPLKTIRDRGGVFLKIWENPDKEGKPVLSFQIGRTFKDPETGAWRESNSLGRNGMEKIPSMVMEASQFARSWENQRRTQARQQQAQSELPINEKPETWLAEECEAALQSAVPEQTETPAAEPTRSPSR